MVVRAFLPMSFATVTEKILPSMTFSEEIACDGAPDRVGPGHGADTGCEGI
jgi:hypothetical protein